MAIIEYLHHGLSMITIVVAFIGLKNAVLDYRHSPVAERSLGMLLVFIAIFFGVLWSTILAFIIALQLLMALSLDLIILILFIGLFELFFTQKV